MSSESNESIEIVEVEKRRGGKRKFISDEEREILISQRQLGLSFAKILKNIRETFPESDINDYRLKREWREYLSL